MLNDAWTAHWAWCCRSDAPDCEIDLATRSLAAAVVTIATEPSAAPVWSLTRTLEATADAIRTDRALVAKIATLQVDLRHRQGPTGWLRAVREGDQLWSVFTSFERKAATVLARHGDVPVLVASEAFGAIHCGTVWRALASERDQERLRFITTRMSVHEDEMKRGATGCRTESIALTEPVVIHVDDSVFTGRTHELFGAALATRPEFVYLASLTVDLGTPFNHPEEMTWDGRSPRDHLERLSQLGRDCDGRLPPLLSFWARRRGYPPVTGDTDQDQLASRLAGSDRLLAALWTHYRERIVHD